MCEHVCAFTYKHVSMYVRMHKYMHVCLLTIFYHGYTKHVKTGKSKRKTESTHSHGRHTQTKSAAKHSINLQPCMCTGTQFGLKI